MKVDQPKANLGVIGVSYKIDSTQKKLVKSETMDIILRVNKHFCIKRN